MKINKCALCSKKIPASGIEKLETIFRKVYVLPTDKKLAAPVSHHPDMILSVIGKKLVCSSDYFKENEAFLIDMCRKENLELVTSDGERGEKYPLDVGFNALVTEKHLFANLKYIDPEVIRVAKESGLEVQHVNQGYSACSTLVIENTVVTADPSIFDAAKGKLEVLLTEGGGISLPPYDTGFIGGAAAYAEGVLFTFGNLEDYGGSDEILAFAAEKNIEICRLFEGALSDFGGIKII